jgi:tetratricopeptide (TPR) repeat protein
MSGQNTRDRAGRCVTTLVIAPLFWAGHSLQAVIADEVPASPASTAAAKDSADPKSAESVKASQDRIQKLIQELGSPKYSVRRTAAGELRQIGAEAFDSLHAATENSDPEIAASANYLLRQIAVRWVQADDPPLMRAILQQYAQEAEAARLQSVEQLSKLPQDAGIAALCRIVRFDRSPLVSRAAAVAIIRPKNASAARPPIEATMVDHELGASTRAAATWLRQYLAQVRDPAASIAGWKQLVEQETDRLEKNGETTNEIIIRLDWNLAELHRQVGDQPAVTALLDRMMDLAGDTSDDTIVNLLEWLTENKSWDVLDTFLNKHQPRLEQSKRPMYYAALARLKQGKSDLAEQLAKRASEIQAQATLEGFVTARDLEEHGQFEWAVREYRRSIDKQPGDSTYESILARISLSTLLHDYKRDKEAADVMEPLVKAVQGNGDVAKLYSRIREYNNGRNPLPEQDSILARYHFYRAGQYQAEKDFTRARGELDLAIKFDGQDADVLIEMYRFPEADDKWRGSVRDRVRELTQKFQQEIDNEPSDASPYNQWAWLVSNTEGDFQKAIRYSHRSLELNTNGESGEASYLDTLGRCYYAAGDYENAVKYERQAIAKQPYMQVMQRQLKEFEKALAKKEAGSKEQGAGSKEPSAP